MSALAGPVSKAMVVAGRADDRQVGDAAEVERGGGVGGPGEQQVVEQAGERGAVTAGRDVAGAQVGDDGNARRLGDPRRLADLQRAPGATFVVDPVEDGLAVGDDEVGGRRRPARRCPPRRPPRTRRRRRCRAGTPPPQSWRPEGARRRARRAATARRRSTGRRAGAARRCRHDSVRSAAATSMPSIDVPLIIPTTRIIPPPRRARCRGGRRHGPPPRRRRRR